MCESGMGKVFAGLSAVHYVLFGLVVLCFAILSHYNFLLFHTGIELFSIIIAFCLFIIAFHTRNLVENAYFLFLGIAYAYIGSMDLIHTLAYEGMGVFPGTTADLATQFWMIARYMESVSLFIAPWFLVNRLRIRTVVFMYSFLSLLLLASVFWWDIFPACFVPGEGLTQFKVISEYIISFILLLSIGHLYRYREYMQSQVYSLIILALITTIGAELAFTFYVDVYGLSNIIGHLFKLISFYFIYRGMVVTTLENPLETLFREINTVNAQLSRYTKELKESNQSLEDFAYIVSHDIQEPLRKIASFSHRLEKEYQSSLDSRGQEYLQRLQHSARRMQAFIENLLQLSRLTSKNYQFSSVNLQNILENVQTDLENLIQEKGACIQVAPLPVIKADPTQMHQLFLNLLKNALLYHREGVAPDVKVKARKHKEKGWEITVADNGMGMSQEDRERLGSSSMPSRGGTGLGLVIVKRIIDRHGGTVEVRSGSGQGTEFIIGLPETQARAGGGTEG